MRTAAKVLGIVGGVFGIIFGFIGMAIGGAGIALGAEGGGIITTLSVIAILLAIAGIVGGALANGHRLASIILLLVPGILGFVCISAFWTLPGILLIVGGILEIASGSRRVPAAGPMAPQYPPAYTPPPVAAYVPPAAPAYVPPAPAAAAVAAAVTEQAPAVAPAPVTEPAPVVAAPPVAAASVAPVSEETPVATPDMRRISGLLDIEGIGPAYAEKLEAAGLKTTDDLLQAGATPKGRDDLATATGISGKLILRWVNMADMFRVKGVGEQYSDLLEAAGVDTVPELAQRRADNLWAKLGEVNEQKQLVRRLPTEVQVAELDRDCPGPAQGGDLLRCCLRCCRRSPDLEGRPSGRPSPPQDGTGGFRIPSLRSGKPITHVEARSVRPGLRVCRASSAAFRGQTRQRQADPDGREGPDGGSADSCRADSGQVCEDKAAWHSSSVTSGASMAVSGAHYGVTVCSCTLIETKNCCLTFPELSA